MATRGQTHNKRAREFALKERRELKQAKKEARAAGLLPVDDEAATSEPGAEEQAETVSEPSL
jgi:hypothetical protein